MAATSSGSSNATPGKTIQPQLPYGHLLTSPIFTIITGPSESAFYVHKELLGNISPEFRKHTHNDMKEGKANAMTLPDVSEDTVARFLQWAYSSDYPDDMELPEISDSKDISKLIEEKDQESKKPADTKDAVPIGSDKPTPIAPSARLLSHARVYVFADRFNISDLKDICFDKLTSILKNLDYLKDPRDVADVIDLLNYAFDNLPLPKNGEKLLSYLTSYAAWTLDILRKDPTFWTLLSSNPDFAKALLNISPEIGSPPWVSAPGTSKSKRKEYLERRCNSCLWQGISVVGCSVCSYYDYEINGEAKGLERLEGTPRSFTLRCLYCNTSRAVNIFCGKCLGSNCSYVN